MMQLAVISVLVIAPATSTFFENEPVLPSVKVTKRKVEGNDRYIFGQGTFNITTEEDYVLIIVDPQGITTSGVSESPGDYSNLLVLPIAQLPDL